MASDANTSKHVDESATMPKSGTVAQIRARMQVYEDAALAHMIQKEEFENHYARNKNQRVQVRTDGEMRRAEQKIEEELVARARRLLQHEQEQIANKDVDVATKLQKDFDEVESERFLQEARKASLDEDARLAARLQAEEEMQARNQLQYHQHASNNGMSTEEVARLIALMEADQ